MGAAHSRIHLLFETLLATSLHSRDSIYSFLFSIKKNPPIQHHQEVSLSSFSRPSSLFPQNIILPPSIHLFISPGWSSSSLIYNKAPSTTFRCLLHNSHLATWILQTRKAQLVHNTTPFWEQGLFLFDIAARTRGCWGVTRGKGGFSEDRIAFFFWERGGGVPISVRYVLWSLRLEAQLGT